MKTPIAKRKERDWSKDTWDLLSLNILIHDQNRNDINFPDLLVRVDKRKKKEKEEEKCVKPQNSAFNTVQIHFSLLEDFSEVVC